MDRGRSGYCSSICPNPDDDVVGARKVIKRGPSHGHSVHSIVQLNCDGCCSLIDVIDGS